MRYDSMWHDLTGPKWRQWLPTIKEIIVVIRDVLACVALFALTLILLPLALG